jgi:hypothetical protein
MEWQPLFNLIGGSLLLGIGWFGRELWTAIQTLKADLKKIEIDLPTNYVRKVEIESRFDKIEAMLGKIFDKLDSKVDK